MLKMLINLLVFVGVVSNSFGGEALKLKFPLFEKPLSLFQNAKGHWVSKGCAAQEDRCLCYQKKADSIPKYNGVSGEAQHCDRVGGSYQIGRDSKGNELGVCLIDESIFFDAAILLGNES